MPAITALCPSCGAPVEFHSGASIVLVCPFCRSTLLRSAEKIENLGRMADLIEDFSPLQLGSEGHYRSAHFAVIGRIQLKYADGLWNEWHLLFDDARNGWLSDANGQYTVSFVEPVAEKLGAFSTLRPGDLIALNSQAFTITDLEEALCVAGDGELPFRVGAGFPAPAADARFGSIFATIDYSEEPPLVFIGEAVSRESLALANLRQNIPGGGPVEKGLKACDCPACGAPINICSQAIQRVACPSCGSLLDAEDQRLKLVEKARERLTIQPLLPLGNKGKLRGVDYEVIGFLRRETKVEDIAYRWDEYLLFDARGEFRWLTCSDGHWNFVRILAKTPPGGGGGSYLNYEGEKFRHFQTCQAEVIYVVGAFNWRVSVGESAQVIDFVAPPRMLSCEKTEREIVWSLGEYLLADEIVDAFKLKTRMPTPIGVYANQPNPRAESHQQTCRFFWRLAGAGLLLHLAFLLLGLGGALDEEMFVFGPTESSHTSKVFEVKNRATTLRVENATSFNNGWLDLNMILVNEDTGQTWQAHREISYYSGVDGGESWSEGSHNDDVVFTKIPPGHYHLALEGEAAPELARTVTSVATVTTRTKVYRSGARWSNFFLLAGLLVLFPIWTRFRLQAFENQRWQESDHPPSSSTEE